LHRASHRRAAPGRLRAVQLRSAPVLHTPAAPVPARSRDRHPDRACGEEWTPYIGAEGGDHRTGSGARRPVVHFYPLRRSRVRAAPLALSRGDSHRSGGWLGNGRLLSSQAATARNELADPPGGVFAFRTRSGSYLCHLSQEASMAGDYTRFTFKPQRDYAGVFKQQGRVDLDADCNELIEIIDRRWRSETIDIISHCIVPTTTPDAFLITPTALGAFDIGIGRMYVDNIHVENNTRPHLADQQVL